MALEHFPFRNVILGKDGGDGLDSVVELRSDNGEGVSFTSDHMIADI